MIYNRTVASSVYLSGADVILIDVQLSRKNLTERTKTFALFLAVVMLALLLLSQASKANAASSSSSTKPTASQLLARLAPNRGLNRACSAFRENEPLCTFGAKPNVLLWGDSFAMQLGLGLKSGAHPIHFVQQTLSVCSPIFDIAPQNANGGVPFAKKCIAENNNVYDWLKRHTNIKYVILGSHWINALATHGTIYKLGGQIGHFSQFAFDQFAITLRKIESLGVKPVVVTETPTNGEDHGACVTRALLAGTATTACAFAHSSDTEIKINTKVAKAAQAAGASVFWLENLLCSKTICDATRGDVILYRDSHHLTMEASVYLGEKFDLGQKLILAAKKRL